MVCPNNGTCQNDSCKCDEGWGGIDCSVAVIPIDSFVGVYYVTGTRQSWIANNGGTYPFNDTLRVIKIDDNTLSVENQDLRYNELDSIRYSYEWEFSSNVNEWIGFNKPHTHDSVFYREVSISPGSGNIKVAAGVKVY